MITRRVCIVGLAGMVLNASGGLTSLDEQGLRTLIGANRGHVLLINFWATWCAPCRNELPKLLQFYSAHRAKGLAFAAICCDEPERESQAAAFISKQGAPLPHYIRRAQDDDRFINAVDPQWSGALPALFLFDRNGRRAFSFVGETDMKKLEDAVKRALAS